MYKVLIIDDEKIIRIALKSMINWEEKGFTVCGTAGNAADALDILKEQSPHLLIVDIMMPEVDGITFVKNVRAAGFSGEIIILSNHQNFNYAVEALHNKVFDYILKTDISPELLNDTLDKVRQILDQTVRRDEPFQEPCPAGNDDRQIFSDVLSSDFPVTETTAFSSPYLCVEIFTRSKLLRDKTPTAIPQDALCNMIQEIPECSPYFTLASDNSSAFLFIPGDKQITFLSTIDTMMSKISTLVKLYMNTQCGFICSGIFRTVSEFTTVLTHLPQLEQLVLFHGFGTLIQETDLSLYSQERMDSASLIRKLKTLCSLEDYENCKAFVTQTINGFSQSSYTPAVVRKQLAEIYSFLIFEHSDCLNNRKNELQKIALQYRQCCILEEYLLLLNELIDLISTSRLSCNLSSLREEIRMVDSYITGHIDKKITLSMLARYVNRSENYLSRIFKAETGINVINYVNTRKIQRAKELLADPAISITEISLSLGFDEPSYFNKIFNKICGINPSDYRKTLLAALKAVQN